jgi:hypothetical protein
MTILTVKDGETPSQQIIADANRVVQVTDTRGRVIGIRKVTTSIRRRVSLAIDGENQSKPLYIGQVMLAAAVCEIDGTPVNLPQNDMQFGALIDRLDDDGFDAVGPAYRDAFLVKEGEQTKAGE